MVFGAKVVFVDGDNVPGAILQIFSKARVIPGICQQIELGLKGPGSALGLPDRFCQEASRLNP